MMTTWVGIDVGKRELVGAATDGRRWQVANAPEGWAMLRTWLPESVHVVLEATGISHQAVWWMLSEAGVPVSVVPPRWVRDYARSFGRRTKTDAVDAVMLARYGADRQPDASVLPSETQREVRALQRCRDDLIQDRTRLVLRHQTMTGLAQQVQTDLLAVSAAKLAAVDAAIAALLAESAELATRMARLRTMPGIGPVIATGLVVLLPELGTGDGGGITALAGLVPHAQESGTQHGYRATQGGRRAVTRLLFLAARTAIRFNPVIRRHYDQLRARGKPGKVALIACARRMLRYLHVMVRDGLDWTELTVVHAHAQEGMPS